MGQFRFLQLDSKHKNMQKLHHKAKDEDDFWTEDDKKSSSDDAKLEKQNARIKQK